MIDYISFILDFYSSSLIFLESLFIGLSIDALFVTVRIVSLEHTHGLISKLEAISKTKTCKIDLIVWEMQTMWIKFCTFLLWMNARVGTQCPFSAPKFRRISAQWMGSGYVCIQPQIWHSMHAFPKFPYNPINFASFGFRYCPQITNPARAPVKQS